MNNLTVLTHTHTDCSDLWPMYTDSYKSYFSEANHIFLVNKESGFEREIVYDESLKYSTRILNALKQISTDYVILSFEDMILIDYVDQGSIRSALKILDKYEISFVRLLKSGISNSQGFDFFNIPLHNLSNLDFSFSITPTIWDREWLVSVLENYPDLSVWDLENKASREIKDFHGLYWYNGERKRGGHYDSSIYPHICSAILKGRWNLSEYPELSPLLEKYGINPEVRGCV